MNTNEINYHLDNCLILNMIQETHFKDFIKAVEHERELAAGLLTWEACIQLAVHKYYENRKISFDTKVSEVES